MTRLLWVSALSCVVGCTWVGEERFDRDIRDVDGDGVPAVRFGGADCRDDDPTIGDCDVDGDDFLSVPAGGDDCDDTDPSVHPGLLFFEDRDNDGFGDPEAEVEGCEAPPGTVTTSTDCDDDDARVNPGAIETCDDLDRNCDGDPVLGADASQWFWDRDGDGHGHEIGDEAACEPPAGQVPIGDDCDDDDEDVYPGAERVWYDGRAEDCDAGVSDWDQDRDGQDVLGAPTTSATDCDDEDARVGVGAAEACDGVDNNCNELVDDEDLDVNQVGQLSWFLDVDRDGVGGPVNGSWCADGAPAGWVLIGGDCDDTRSTVSPGATEVCNNRDDDCNGYDDDGAVDRLTVYEDQDRDGYGQLPSLACGVTVGFTLEGGDCDDLDDQSYPGAPEVCGDALRQDCSAFSVDDCDSDGQEDRGAGGTDCDDTDPDVHVGATEVCDGLDNDCDDLLDGDDPEVLTYPDWYVDFDGDGFGIEFLVAASTCTPPPFSATNTDDCDDLLATVNPDADEICNSRDDDCDDAIDEDTTDLGATWYWDADADGAGDPTRTLANVCVPPAGEPWVDVGGDCDDDDPTRSPLVAEVCGGLDDDCDLLVDDDDPSVLPSAPPWYLDLDGDGFGELTSVTRACSQPADYAAVPGDCNDLDERQNPGASEVCNAGVDDDCDALSDDADPDLGGTVTWFADGDGDGFGDPADGVQACAQPPGRVAIALDCLDTDPTVSPAALEQCDGIDNDCDERMDDADDFALGSTPWFTDADGDGFGVGAAVTACVRPPGTSATTGDCDDGRPEISPVADEVCGGRDDDCDRLVDDDDPSVIGAPWFEDMDGDTWGSATFALGCDLSSSGHVSRSGDCSDADPQVHPGAQETCDGADQDCDAATDEEAADAVGWLDDGDGDGFGAGVAILACVAPPGAVLDRGPTSVDCDDDELQVWPGYPLELCDGLDNDCDGLAEGLDADTPSPGPAAYADTDGDGFGAGPVVVCVEPYTTPGVVPFGGDCDAGDPTRHPLATEDCDGADDDCDGLVDDADPGLSGGLRWYEDLDLDGFGGWTVTTTTCGAVPAGSWSPVAGDCDDADGLAWPGGPVDCAWGGSSAPCASRTWFEDGDDDGYGVATSTVSACVAPPGFVENAFDCDDGLQGDVITTAVSTAGEILAAVTNGGCQLVELSPGFDEAVRLIGPAGSTTSITSADPTARGVLRQGPASAPVIDAKNAATLVLDGVDLVGDLGGPLLVVDNAGARVTLRDVSLDGGGSSSGLDVATGAVSAERLRVTATAGTDGTALRVRAPGALRLHEATITEAAGDSAVHVEADGDDVSMSRLTLRRSARVRVVGAGRCTLTELELWAPVGDGLVTDAPAAVSDVDGLLVFGAGGTAVLGAAGATTVHGASIAGSAVDGIAGRNVLVTDGIVVDSGGLDLRALSGGPVTYDHALFTSSSGNVAGGAPVVGDPAFVAYHPDAPAELVDLHLAPGSAAIGAGAAGGDLGRFPDTDPWYEDLDADLLPDGWERRWFGVLGLTAADDPDEDLADDGLELALGTCPTLPDSDEDGAGDLVDGSPLDPGAR